MLREVTRVASTPAYLRPLGPATNMRAVPEYLMLSNYRFQARGSAIEASLKGLINQIAIPFHNCPARLYKTTAETMSVVIIQPIQLLR